MATIPESIDYGGRPSLRSNRVDLPGTRDLATGDALARAAGTFAQIVGQQQAKEDRLNYSLAKNELLLADIAEREKLKDDQDYKTWDERYTTGFNTARDEISTRFDLSPANRQLWSAESDLIRERARVQVGDAARTMDLDIKQASVRENLLIAKKEILNLDPASANELMLTQLENIQAAVAEGIFDENEGLTLSQTFVKDTAYARLVGMEVKDRIEELTRSLAHRKQPKSAGPQGPPPGLIEKGNIDLKNRPQVKRADGSLATVHSMSFGEDGVEILIPTITDSGEDLSDKEAKELYRKTGKHLGKFKTPEQATAYAKNLSAAQGRFYRSGAISVEDIQAGKGSESIADFLNKDVVVEMLRKAEAENEGEEDLAAAYDLIDQAEELFTADTEEAREKKMAYVTKNASSAAIRAVATSKLTAMLNEQRRVELGMQTELVSSASELMRNGVPDPEIEGATIPFTPDMIPRKEWDTLTAAQKASLFALDKQLRQDKLFSDIDYLTLDPKGRKSTAYWYNLSPEQQIAENLDSAEWYTRLTADTWNFFKRQQEAERDRVANAKAPALDQGQTNQQMLTAALVSTGLVPQTGRTDPENEKYQSAWITFDMALQEAQDIKDGRLTNEERRLVLAEVMKRTVFVDRDFFWFDSDIDEEDRLTALTLSDDQRAKAWLPWAEAEADIVYIGGNPMTAASVLENFAKTQKPQIEWDKVSSDDRERAYYALMFGLGDAEILKRLKGD